MNAMSSITKKSYGAFGSAPLRGRKIDKDESSCKLSWLNAFQLKFIALICMTIDHVGAYGFEIPGIAAHVTILRLIGRIAAPLFLFVLIQSARNTRSKSKFILRLYFAGVATGLFQVATNALLGDVFGIFSNGNIFFTFFYVVLYSYLAEELIKCIRNRNLRDACFTGLICLLSFLPNLIYDAINHASLPTMLINDKMFWQGLRDSLLPANHYMEFGLGFILLGVLLYFAKTKRGECSVYLVFCSICFLGAFVARSHSVLFYYSSFASTYFNFQQCWMILALPFMLLYNGLRGANRKYFFYAYYPVHRYLLVILFRCLGR